MYEIELPFRKMPLCFLEIKSHPVTSIRYAGKMNKEVPSLELEGVNSLSRIKRLLISIEPTLREIENIVSKVFLFQHFDESALIAVLELSFGMVIWEGDDSGNELNRPRMHFNKENTVVEPVRISSDKKMDMGECWRGKENLERDIGVHDDTVGVEPPGDHVNWRALHVVLNQMAHISHVSRSPSGLRSSSSRAESIVAGLVQTPSRSP